MNIIYTLVLVLLFIGQSIAQQNEIIHLWPNKVPGEVEEKHAPVTQDNRSGNTTRLTDITDPTLTVYKASADMNNGTGIIVCPGGGYKMLAIDLEGYEIAEWLRKLGYTAFVLEYRVPNKQMGALNDIQRAIRIVRSKADKWMTNPQKLGIIGFSAGGSLCARASTLYKEDSYSAIDQIDTISCRPDFSLLIYPAYLDKGENRALTPELQVNKKTPSMFLFCTADDKYGNSALVMATALRDSKVPVELHVLANGGHGYGLRAGTTAGETWPKLAEIWLKNLSKN